MCASHTFLSFYVAHLAQPNEPSRRRVVAVIKNDWAQPNPKCLKTKTPSPLPCQHQGLTTTSTILPAMHICVPIGLTKQRLIGFL
jgi:hypothetical protein